MFDLDEFLSLAAKQESGRVRDAMLLAAMEIERVREETKSANEAFAWQERVCAIVQPAQNADEWGANVADIIACRLDELKAARAVVERAREWSRMGLYDARLNEMLDAYDAARPASSTLT